MSKSILNIYKEYNIPPNLQFHMLRVAALGLLLTESFDKNISINKSGIITALLLHDMGNILKFDINVTRSLGVSEEGLKQIEITKEEFKTKYGADEHNATYKIAEEIGISDESLRIITNMGSSKIEYLLKTEFWDAKIATYADNRIDPVGVTTLSARWNDIVKRYSGSTHKLGDKNIVERRRKYSFELEKQIQEKCGMDLQSVTDTTILPYFEKVKLVEISRDN